MIQLYYNFLCAFLFFLMIRRPPRSTRTDTLFPYTTLFRSNVLLAGLSMVALGATKAKAKMQEAKPLRIGVLNDMSGIYTDISGKGSVIAAEMAAEDFVAQGGDLGRPIQVISGDHQNKADIGASIARKWIDRDGVDAIDDLPNSAVALAVNKIVRNKNKTMLVSGASSTSLTKIGRAS